MKHKQTLFTYGCVYNNIGVYSNINALAGMQRNSYYFGTCEFTQQLLPIINNYMYTFTKI